MTDPKNYKDILLSRIATLCRRDEYMQHLEKRTLSRWIETVVVGNPSSLNKLEDELEEELRSCD